MRVSSELAELEIRLGRIVRKDNALVVESAPGSSLDTRIRIDPEDAKSILGKLLGSGAVWSFLLRLPFAGRTGTARRAGTPESRTQGAKDNPVWRARRESTGLNKPW